MQKESNRNKRKKNTISKSAWQNRSYNSNGNNVGDTLRSSRRKRTGVAIGNIFGANCIIKDKSSLEVDLILNQGIFSKSTPETVIKDIFPEIKDNLKLEGLEFSEITRPIDFLDAILKAYKPSIKHEEWDLYYDGASSKHVIFCVHDIDKIPIKGYCPELDFLPILSKNNRNLYDLFIGLFGLFNNTLYSTFYFDDDELEYAIEYVESGIEDEEEEDVKASDQDYITMYKSGSAKVVEDEIKSSKIKLPMLKKKLKAFVPNNDIESSCVDFIKESIKLFRYKDNFCKYIHFVGEELEEGTPINPSVYACLDWNFSKNNPIAKHQQMITNSNWGEYGDVPFRYETINGKEKKPSKFIFDYVKMLEILCDISMSVKDSESS